jgi:hypothetical protein
MLNPSPAVAIPIPVPLMTSLRVKDRFAISPSLFPGERSTHRRIVRLNPLEHSPTGFPRSNARFVNGMPVFSSGCVRRNIQITAATDGQESQGILKPGYT